MPDSSLDDILDPSMIAVIVECLYRYRTITAVMGKEEAHSSPKSLLLRLDRSSETIENFHLHFTQGAYTLPVEKQIDPPSIR